MDERERESTRCVVGTERERELKDLLDRKRRECAEFHVTGADVKGLRGQVAELLEALEREHRENRQLVPFSPLTCSTCCLIAKHRERV